MKLVECVPNFSEGKDRSVIDQIINEICSVDGIELKDVDMGADVNRTVVTFLGTPEQVEEAAFKAIAKAAELIDMSKHRGSHPRIGATDVCPFVPVRGVTMADCAEIAIRLGERVGKVLGIPVYLYEEAASENKRKNLAAVRSGEYEGLKKKMSDLEWKPDYGPDEYDDIVKKTGAVVIGAREFLIAYNINLNTRQTKIATDIALELRERGRSKREVRDDGHYWKGKIVRYGSGHYPCGECEHVATSFRDVLEHTEKEHSYDLKVFLEEQYDYDVDDLKGKPVKKKGRFTHCKAIGWYIDEYDRAQISIDLTNYKITSIHDVYEEAKKVAEEMGVVVTGSEIVGLVPYNALLEAGKHYLRKQGQPTGLPFWDVLETAVQSLGLREVTSFDIKDKVIGLPLARDNELIGMAVDDFTHELSRDSATLCGGGAAALSGALGAGLLSMVCNLSTGDRGTEQADIELIPVAEKLQSLKDALLQAVDEDTKAFDIYMSARNLPDNTPEERECKDVSIEEGLRKAMEVPLRTAELSCEVMDLADKVVEYCKESVVSDVLIGSQLAFSGIVGGIASVKINLGDLKDEEYTSIVERRCREMHESYLDRLHSINHRVESRLKVNR